MKSFLPMFEGSIAAASIPPDFVSRLAERIRTGLIVPGSRRRADYAVASLARDRISFRAASFWTAVSIGLNEVVVERGSTTISYCVRYWTWTLYCVGGCALLFVLLTVSGFVWAEKDIQAHPYGPLLFWGQAIFWGFAWPWLLTAFHKRFAARCLEGILRELLQAPSRT